MNDPAVDHEYLPITGLPEFTSAAARLVFGSDAAVITEERVTSVQTISGTGANHLGALFLSRFYHWNDKRVYLSDPTWGMCSPIQSFPTSCLACQQPRVGLCGGGWGHDMTVGERSSVID